MKIGSAIIIWLTLQVLSQTLQDCMEEATSESSCMECESKFGSTLKFNPNVCSNLNPCQCNNFCGYKKCKKACNSDPQCKFESGVCKNRKGTRITCLTDSTAVPIFTPTILPTQLSTKSPTTSPRSSTTTIPSGLTTTPSPSGSTPTTSPSGSTLPPSTNSPHPSAAPHSTSGSLTTSNPSTHSPSQHPIITPSPTLVPPSTSAPSNQDRTFGLSQSEVALIATFVPLFTVIIVMVGDYLSGKKGGYVSTTEKYVNQDNVARVREFFANHFNIANGSQGQSPSGVAQGSQGQSPSGVAQGSQGQSPNALERT